MTEPLFSLYKDAKCVSSRKDLAGINGARVGIIRRRQRDDGVWEYTVSPNKSYVFYVCEESDLTSVVPINIFADDRPFAAIRCALQYGLCQDWDSRFETLAEALLDGLKSVDIAALRAEVAELAKQPDDLIREVLDDGVANVLEFVTPKDLLLAIRTLLDLM